MKSGFVAIAFVTLEVISYSNIRNTGYFDSLNHFLDDFRDVLHLDLFGNIHG